MEGEHPGRSAAAELREHGLRPRKRLGQNFLRDRSYLRRILDAGDIGSEDEVLEIGAGTGVLTAALLERARRVVAIELDDSLFALLQKRMGSFSRLELRHGDALRFDPAAAFQGPYKLVGNIPYYITGPLVRRYLETAHRPEVLVFMVQAEVAERITAPPGKLSLLGVSVQYYADARVVARVPAGAFHPVPRVDSAILRLTPHDRSHATDPEIFFRVVRAGFSMRRKQLANTLAAGLGLDRRTTDQLLRYAALDGTRRAETLSLEEWNELAQCYRAHTAGEA